MKRVSLFLLLSIYSLPSCSSQGDPKSILDLFDQIDLLQGEVLSHDIFIGRPAQLHITGSFLFFLDFYQDRFMTVVNLLTGETKRVLRMGRGPNELISPIRITQLINDSILNIYETFSSSSIQFNVKDILEKSDPPIIKRTRFAQDGSIRPVQEADRFYIGTGLRLEQMFAIFDKSGQKTHEYIPYPKEAEQFEIRPRSIAYQFDFKISPDGTKLVQAGFYFDLLCFYRVDPDHITEHKRYFFNDAHVVENRDKTGVDILPNTKMYYTSLYPTRDRVYALYGEGYGGKNKTYYLLCFDWDGNPLKAYKFDRSLFSICVNEAGTELFVLAMENGEGLIVRYKLS